MMRCFIILTHKNRDMVTKVIWFFENHVLSLFKQKNKDMSFSDLKFKIRDDGMQHAIMKVGKYKLSVIAGKYAYSSPRLNLVDINDFNTFECAIIKENGDFATRDIFENMYDDVISNVTREGIDELIKEIQQQ